MIGADDGFGFGGWNSLRWPGKAVPSTPRLNVPALEVEGLDLTAGFLSPS